ncbi:MAG: hypothetical protein KatS3mg112_1008 [Thermogutta sp.]|nr:MAG: hypothetical protein KatS3mg112_1008 [Thermogutta sp.]
MPQGFLGIHQRLVSFLTRRRNSPVSFAINREKSRCACGLFAQDLSLCARVPTRAGAWRSDLGREGHGFSCRPLRVDGVFMGLFLSPGDWLLTWTYHPPGLAFGAALSVCGWSLVCGMVLFGPIARLVSRRTRKNHSARD